MIDWFTVSAQIINFLILIFLLKKFLYGPIIRAMDRREETIAGRLNEAGRKQEDAREEIERFRRKCEEFESQRAGMLAGAKADAEQQKKELVTAARKEVEDIKARWREAAGQERDAFLRSLRNRIADRVYSIARKACADLADVSLEEHMTDMFVKKMKALDGAELDDTRAKLKVAGPDITVATSFEIPGHKLQAVREAAGWITGTGRQPEFVTSKDILCGIELRAGGYTLGWNLDAYLTSLEEEFGRMLE